MGYLDGLAEPMFKRDAAGGIVFFPAGKLARGRVLPDEATAAGLKQIVKYGTLAMIVVVVVLVLTLDFWIAFPLAILIAAGYQVFLFSRVSRFPRSDARLSYAEINRAQANAMGTGWIVALAGISLLLLASSLWVALGSDGNPWIGWLGVLLFGACLGLFAYQLRIKLRG